MKHFLLTLSIVAIMPSHGRKTRQFKPQNFFHKNYKNQPLCKSKNVKKERPTNNTIKQYIPYCLALVGVGFFGYLGYGFMNKKPLEVDIEDHNRELKFVLQALNKIKKPSNLSLDRRKRLVKPFILELKQFGIPYNEKADKLIVKANDILGPSNSLLIKTCTHGLNDFLDEIAEQKKQFILLLRDNLSNDEFTALFPGFTNHNSLGREPNPIAHKIPRFTTIRSIKGGIEESIFHGTPDFTTNTDDFSSTHLRNIKKVSWCYH